MDEQLRERARTMRDRFESVFSSRPDAAAYGPGRVDLLGSHTDYNDGFVLPVAIDMEVLAVGRVRNDELVRVWSEDFRQFSRFPLDRIRFDSRMKWSNYVRGVVVFLQEAGARLGGADVLLSGRVPIASGLSSSAAIEMAIATLFQELFRLDIPDAELALIGQRAENLFVGVNTGIMDQFASRLGRKGHALFLDCRTLEYDYVPVPSDRVRIVVSDTMKRRGLVTSEYNLRRSECEQAAAALRLSALRDMGAEEFERRKSELSGVIRKRAEHVINENERVLKSRQLLRDGDLTGFGRLMNASHESARDLYEVSCAELEAMVAAARSVPGVLGSRMAGAGFGGCTVSLVRDESVGAFVEAAKAGYEKRTGLVPSIYVCTAEDGASVVA